MSKSHLKTSFFCCSGPVLSLAAVNASIGSLFLWVDSSVGWIFLLIAAISLATFGVVGAAHGRSLHRRQLTPSFGRVSADQREPTRA